MRFYSIALVVLLVVLGNRGLQAASQGFLYTGGSVYSLFPDGTTNEAQWTSIVYDTKGNPIRSSTVVSRYNGFGASYLETVTCSFDKSGELLTSVTEIDDNLDGTIDARVTTTHTRLSETVTQDVTESDWSNDGIIDYESIDTQTSDETGRPIRLVTEARFYGFFPQTNIYIQTWTYIEGKDSLVIVSTFDSNADDIPDSLIRSTQLKNNKGQIISYTYEYEEHASGIIDSVGTATLSYDRHGNLSQWSESWTDGLSGTWVMNFSYENRGAVRQQSRAENQALGLIRKLHGAQLIRGISRPFRPHP